MGYYIYLTDDRGHSEGEWNYTHNCNGMANAVLDPEYKQRSVAEEVFCFKDQEHISWWRRLDGLSGPDGAALLHTIITGLESDPEQFRAMNPANGWGDYNTFLAMLKEIRGSVPEWPCRWRVHG
jgi:hypothetical protein